MGERHLEARLYSEEEYLALDADLDVKYEFYDGHIVAMAGANSKHVSLTSQTSRALNNRLDDTNCQAGSSDLRVQMEGAKNYLYPDVVLWCDDARWADEAQNTLLTPLVVIEVLSNSTGYRDSSIKLTIYKNIPSVTDYLIVSANRVSIEHFRRGDEGGRWESISYYRRDQVIQFRAMDLEIPVSEIYRKVDVPEQMVLFETDDE